MNISFGNTFHLYCKDIEKIDAQDTIVSEAKDTGIETRRIYSDWLVDVFGNPTTFPIDDKKIFYKDVLMLKGETSLDNIIRSYCLQNGIEFKEVDEKILFDEQKIRDRIVLSKTLSEQDYEIVLVDSQRLNELINITNISANNFGNVKFDYERAFSKEAMYIIKSGDKIPAPIIKARKKTRFELPELQRYYKRYKYKDMNRDILSVTIDMKAGAEHVTYYTLQDIGIRYIPMAMDKETREIFNIIGITQPSESKK